MPQHADALDATSRSTAAVVSGSNRVLYTRRPFLASSNYQTEDAMMSDLQTARVPAEPEPPSKTIGTQSDYRESEAQTLPWEPDYVVPKEPTEMQRLRQVAYNSDGPEILHLRGLNFGDGLPAGLAEVQHIKKLREKRAFEATLPPLDDVDRLPLRLKMIEEWETREWAERDVEVRQLQEERLELLDQALQVREEEIEAEAAQRVEDKKATLLQQKAGKFAMLQSSRIKTMRQLIEKRRHVEVPGSSTSQQQAAVNIVQAYADYGSSKYAPVTRDGRFPESAGQRVESELFSPASLRGVLDLEASLPRKMLDPLSGSSHLISCLPTLRQTGSLTGKLDFRQRADAKRQADLETVSGLLETSKKAAGRGYGDCWPAPLGASPPGKGGRGGDDLAAAGDLTSDLAMLGSSSGAGGGVSGTMKKKAYKLVERPTTPVLPLPPAMEGGETHAAAVLLQKLLRGRAVQNAMHDGRSRRVQLLQELRAAQAEASGAPRPLRPEDRQPAVARLDALIGSAVSEIAWVLCDPDSAGQAQALLAILSSRQAAVEAAAEAASREEEQAAVVVQAAIRGHLTRKRVAAMKAGGADAGLPSASAAGGSDELGEPLGLAAASGSMRNWMLLTWRLRKHVNKQTALSQQLGVSAEEAEEAAIKIQAAMRGRKARKEVAAMRSKGAALRHQLMTTAELDPQDEAKVVRIQALARGRLARKQVAGMRGAAAEATTDGQQQSHSGLGVRSSSSLAQLSPDFSEEDVQKVVRIQAAARGKQARQQVKAMRAEAAGAAGGSPGRSRIQKASEAPSRSSGLLAASLTAEDEACVVKVQALARRKLAQKHLMAKRQAAAAAPPPILVVLTAEEESVVKRVQGMQTERLQREQIKRVLATFEEASQVEELADVTLTLLPAKLMLTGEEHALVGRLQASVRTRFSRKQIVALRNHVAKRGGELAVLLLPDFTSDESSQLAAMLEVARDRTILELIHRHKALRNAARVQAKPEETLASLTADDEAKIIRIQVAYRGRMARLQVAKMRAELQAAGMTAEEAQAHAPDLPQPGDAAGASAVDAAAAAAEDFFSKVYTEEEQVAIVKIQTAQRARLARRQVTMMRAEQATYGDEAAVDLLPEYTAEEEAAIIKIQAAARGRLARKKVAALRASKAAASSADTGGTLLPQSSAAAPSSQQEGTPEAAAEETEAEQENKSQAEDEADAGDGGAAARDDGGEDTEAAAAGAAAEEEET